MQDFVLIFKGTNYAELGLSPEEMQQKLGKWWAWQGKMQEKGILKGGHALQNNVRLVQGPERTVTDHASAALKEVIGGYYVVSAKDMEEATAIAQDYPDFDEGGQVEIRPVMVYE